MGLTATGDALSTTLQAIGQSDLNTLEQIGQGLGVYGQAQQNADNSLQKLYNAENWALWAGIALFGLLVIKRHKHVEYRFI